LHLGTGAVAGAKFISELPAMHAYSCPSCHEPVLVHESWGGQPSGCPLCGHRFLLPADFQQKRTPTAHAVTTGPELVTDWSKVIGRSTVEPRVLPTEWNDTGRGLRFIQAAIVVFLTTTILWYTVLMLSLGERNAFLKPVLETARVLAFAGLGVGIVIYLAGLRYCLYVPDIANARRASRGAWLFTQAGIAGFLTAAGDQALGANHLLPDGVTFAVLFATVLVAVIGHICFIRFLQGVTDYLSSGGGRAAGFYQLFFALVLAGHVLGFLVLAQNVQKDMRPGNEHFMTQMRFVTTVAGALYVALEVWVWNLVAGALHILHVRVTARR
jgi:hypothetical protein